MLSYVFTKCSLNTKGTYSGKGIQYVYKFQLNMKGI